ncbi:MAG: hypothetical protein H6739_15025 [Alphaproteobacteria bacterium]|nr:hypothetical protein [Alphaproteobacteria bacterium]
MSDEPQGQVLSKGRFRVDRRRALEKMERFQLEDPHRYVLEWLAAAACAGTDKVTVVNDSDDCVLSWTGLTPTGAELDSLFDHLWGEPTTARGAMLQHLAVGVIGALGLDPRWTMVDCGDGDTALRLDVKDPSETRHAPLKEAVDGVRCHVRERLTSTTFAEALALAFREPAEAQLVRGAARRFPVPIEINGARIPTTPEPSASALRWIGVDGDRSGGLWVVPAALDEGVDVVRHGLVVGHLNIPLGDFAVTGWYQDDALRLNASRSRVVHDARWNQCADALHSRIDALLRAGLSAPPEDEPQRWRGAGERTAFSYTATTHELLQRLLPHAVRRMQLRTVPLGPLAELPLVADLSGRVWSAKALLELPSPPGTTELLVADPGDDLIVFDVKLVELLRSLRADLVDHTPMLTDRAEGRRRRAEAVRSEPWFHDGRAQRRFHRDGVRGAVSWPRKNTKPDVTRVRLSLDGRVVGDHDLTTPGLCLDAVLDHPGFTTDTRFTRVLVDDTFRGAADALREETDAFVLDEARRAHTPDQQAQVLEAVQGIVHRRTKAMRKRPRRALMTILGDDLLAVPLLPRGAGGRLSLGELLRDEEPFWILEALPDACPRDVAERVVLLPHEQGRRWLKLLPDILVDGGPAIHDRIERARRMALGPRPPRLRGAAEVVHRFESKTVRGELGWRLMAGEGAATVDVLRAGIPVGLYPLAPTLPGVFGEIDVPDARVSLAHDALEPGELERITEALSAHVNDLALKVWHSHPAGVPSVIVTWLTRPELEKGIPGAARARPIGRRADGSNFTLGDLLRFTTERSKGDARLQVASEDPGPTPGFDEVVRLMPGAMALVQAFGKGDVRVRDADIMQARHVMEQYFQRPVYEQPPAMARKPVHGGDWTGEVLLPIDPELLGQARVVGIWHQRVLATRVRKSELGGTVIVEGKAFQPTQNLDNVINSPRLTGLLKQARRTLPALVEAALADPAVAPPHHIPSWRRLVALAWDANWQTSGRARLKELLGALPLLRRIDGATVTADALLAAASESPRLLPPDTPEGPSDTPWYILDEPGVADLVKAVLSRTVPDGKAHLEAWRAAQRRLASVQRVEPVLTHATLAREPFEAGGGRGELGLVEGRPGLTITPLFEGIPLRKVQLDFPVAVEAIVTGAAVKADPALETVREGVPWRTLCDTISSRARDLAVRTAIHIQTPEVIEVARQYVLNAPDPGKVEELNLFPLLGGGQASLAELKKRERRDGAVGVIYANPRMLTATFPNPTAPVVADTALRRALGAKVKVLPLDARFERLLDGLPRRGLEVFGEPLALSGKRTGNVALPFRTATGLVEVVMGGLKLDTLEVDAPVPVIGWVQDEALTPKPLLEGVVADGARRTLLRHLSLQARETLKALCDKPDDHNRPLLVRALMAMTPRRAPLRAAVADDAEGLIGALAALPLFRTSTGRLGSLRDMAAHQPIRAVQPGRTGTPLPGRSPFWPLTPEERAWMDRGFTVVVADDELLAESQGSLRRNTAPHLKQVPSWVEHQVRLSRDGVEVVLWLDDPDVSRLALLVDGVLAERRSASFPGLNGWVDGSFDTDTAFTTVQLPAVAEALLDEGTRTLLHREAGSGDPGRLSLLARVIRIKQGRPIGKLLAEEKHLAELAPFLDLRGRPVTLGAIRDELKQHRSLLWAEAGEADPDDAGDRLTLALRYDLRAQLVDVLGGSLALVHLPTRKAEDQAEAARRQAAVEKRAREREEETARRAAEAEAAKAEAARLEAQAQVQARVRAVEAIVKAHRAQTDDDRGDTLLDGWMERGAPPWLDGVDPNAPEVALVAWFAVGAQRRLTDADVDAELSLLLRVARTLRGSLR